MSRSTFGGTVTAGGSAVAGLIDFTPPGVSAPAIDISNHSAAWAAFAKGGRKIAGTCTIEMQEGGTDAGRDAIIAAIGADAIAFVITPNGGTAYTFNGLVVDLAPGSNPLDGQGTISATVQPVGEVP